MALLLLLTPPFAVVTVLAGRAVIPAAPNRHRPPAVAVAVSLTDTLPCHHQRPPSPPPPPCAVVVVVGFAALRCRSPSAAPAYHRPGVGRRHRLCQTASDRPRWLCADPCLPARRARAHQRNRSRATLSPCFAAVPRRRRTTPAPLGAPCCPSDARRRAVRRARRRRQHRRHRARAVHLPARPPRPDALSPAGSRPVVRARPPARPPGRHRPTVERRRAAQTRQPDQQQQPTAPAAAAFARICRAPRAAPPRRTPICRVARVRPRRVHPHAPSNSNTSRRQHHQQHTPPALSITSNSCLLLRRAPSGRPDARQHRCSQTVDAFGYAFAPDAAARRRRRARSVAANSTATTTTTATLLPSTPHRRCHTSNIGRCCHLLLSPTFARAVTPPPSPTPAPPAFAPTPYFRRPGAQQHTNTALLPFAGAPGTPNSNNNSQQHAAQPPYAMSRAPPPPSPALSRRLYRSVADTTRPPVRFARCHRVTIARPPAAGNAVYAVAAAQGAAAAVAVICHLRRRRPGTARSPPPAFGCPPFVDRLPSPLPPLSHHRPAPPYAPPPPPTARHRTSAPHNNAQRRARRRRQRVGHARRSDTRRRTTTAHAPSTDTTTTTTTSQDTTASAAA